MAKAKANTELCKGCRLCVGVCPRKAIVPLTTVNKKGYEIIRIDEEACIGCGMCYKCAQTTCLPLSKRRKQTCVKIMCW